MRITLQIYPRSERNEGKTLLDTSAASRRSIILIASKIARKRRRERRSGAINDELKWKTRRMNRRRFIKVPAPPTESIFFRSFRGRYSNSCGKRSLTAREIYLSRGNCDGDGSIEKIAVKRGNAIVDFTYRFEIP